MKKAGFIGSGNMGGALIEAACRSVGADQVIIANRTRAKAEALARKIGCTVAENNGQVVEQAEYIFLCVKPQMFQDLCSAITPYLTECLNRGEKKVLVSIAAGLRTETIRGLFPKFKADIPILWVMPNTCAAIGKGMLAIAGGEVAVRQHYTEIEEILSGAGRLEQLSESQMDAFSAVAGCGPAFAYQFIEALADGGVMAGLTRQQALTYAAQTVMGAAAMVLESGKHPGQLKDEVCSPGGSTIAGVAALERRGLRAAAIDAVQAAYARNCELGKQV